MQTLKFLKAHCELLALSNTTLPELQKASRNAAKLGQNEAQNLAKKIASSHA